MIDKLTLELWGTYGILGLGWIVAGYLGKRLLNTQAECEKKIIAVTEQYNRAQLETVRVLTTQADAATLLKNLLERLKT